MSENNSSSDTDLEPTTPLGRRATKAVSDMAQKSCYIKTYGCQMNVYDSERMAEALTQSGYKPVDSPEEADMIILNTCHIREKAAEKVYSELGRLKPLKQKNKDLIFGVAGCVAQAEGEEILSRAPSVDMVFGPQTYHDLPAMLSELSLKREAGQRPNIVRTSFPADEKFAALSVRQPLRRLPSAFVTIQEGCDKFCTFCVVPYTRGAEVSRATADIEAEVLALVEQGVREVTLLGQNVNAWQDRESGLRLAGLLRQLSQIKGIERLRFTTSHPRDMDDELIAVHGDLPELMPYLHLPVQSGSDRILKLMNRHHTSESYLDLVAKFRLARPDLALSSDFIVGFPGETDADFEATMELVRKVQYAQAFSFKYSPRHGTPAAEEDQVPENIKSERLARLQALLDEQQIAFHASLVGRVLPVLFEKKGTVDGQLIGRSPYLQPVRVQLPEEAIGKILPIRIEAGHLRALSGVLSEDTLD